MAHQMLDERRIPNDLQGNTSDGRTIEPSRDRHESSVREGRCIGHYRLEDRIGGGGMADVWSARAPETHAAVRVAIKRVRPELAPNASYRIMFCEEARINALLSGHPNIVRLIDFDVFQGEPFMVFEYVDGVSVSRLMRLSWVRKNNMPLGVALFVARQVLVALESAHSAVDERAVPLGIVHRDVSPENILVARTGTVKLTDFGIVHARGVRGGTAPGGLKGKLGYMAPEQIAGGEVDARSDLFSLGIVLAEMLTHAPLFRGLDELELLTRMYHVDWSGLEGSQLSPRVRALLGRALSPRPSQRFQSAQEFRLELEQLASGYGMHLDERLLEDWFADLDVVPRHSGTFRVACAESSECNPELLERIERARLLFAENAASSPAGETWNAQGWARSSRRGPAHRAMPTIHSEAITLDAPGVGEAEQTSGVYRSSTVDPAGAARFGAPAIEAATWYEKLDRARFMGVLCGLVAGRHTGLLRVCSGAREKRLYFSSGALSFIASTEPEELLGRRLVAHGALRAVDVDRALITAAAQRRRLGEALVAHGLLPAHVVLRALIAQLEERFLELGNWHEGVLAFYADAHTKLPGVRVQASPLELVFRLVRQSYSSSELRRILTPVETHALLRSDFSGLPFSDAEQHVLRAIDRAPSLNSLVARLAALEGVSPIDTYRAVFLAMSSGVLTTRGPASPSFPQSKPDPVARPC